MSNQDTNCPVDEAEGQNPGLTCACEYCDSPATHPDPHRLGIVGGYFAVLCRECFEQSREWIAEQNVVR